MTIGTERQFSIRRRLRVSRDRCTKRLFASVAFRSTERIMRVIATPSLWHAFSAEAAHVVHSEGCPSSRNQARLPLRYWESQLFHGGAANETHAHVQHCVRASPWGGPKLTRYTPVKRGIPLLLQGI